jgi:hypothetical protein
VSGWASSNRRSELPKDWHKRVARTKKRAGGMCEWPACTAPGSQCDHRGDPLDHDDLQWLCAPHHRIKTQRESLAAKQLPPRQRPPEIHPRRLR